MAKLFFRYGAMNSGKSTSLIQIAYNYEERGKKVLLIKPAIDSKGDDKITSRIGASRKVDYLIKESDSIFDVIKLDNIDCILVDEVQFMSSNQIDELYEITKNYNITVMGFGLRCDFSMKGFSGSTRLLEIADDIQELKTVCRCGSKATQNMRKINNKVCFTGSSILIDNSSEVTYESVCGKCYLEEKYKHTS